MARMRMAHFRCFSASVTRDQVLATTDSKWLGDYMQKVAASEDVAGAENMNEYYRKNFRKVTTV